MRPDGRATMEFQVEEKSPVSRRVEAQVSGKALGAEENKAYNRLRKTAKVNGFRKGRIPNGVLRKMYGQQVRADAMQQLVQRSMESIIGDIPNLIHVSPWKVVEARNTDGGFTFEVEVEVRPALEVGDYKGVEIKAPRVEVEDSAIDAELEKLQEQYTSLAEVEDRDKCDTGDLVSIDYAARGEGEIANLKNDDQLVEIGSGTAIAGLEDGLVGATLGETVEVEVTLPDPFPAIADMAGQKIILEVTPKVIKHKVVPALDDEFAKDTGRGDTLAELRTSIGDEKREEAEKGRAQHIDDAILAALRDANPVELPEGYIEQRAQERTQQTLSQFLQQGLPQDFLTQYASQLMSGAREEVRQSVHNEVIVESIAESEGVEISDDERESWLEARAEEAGQPLSQLRRMYTSADMAPVLDANVRREKVLELLRAEAKVEDVDPSELVDAPEAPAEDGDDADSEASEEG